MRTSMYDRISERREREKILAQKVSRSEPPISPRFFTNELSFQRPRQFKDKTFNVLTLTDTGPSPFSFVIGRTSVGENSDLETLSQTLLKELEKTLSHIHWIEPVSPVMVAGQSGYRVEFRWRQKGQPVHQVQIIFLHKDEHGQLLLMQITGTSNNPKGMTGEERTAFDEMIESLEVRSSLNSLGGTQEDATA